MSVSNLNYGISLNKRFVLRHMLSILLQLMHLLLLPFANLVSALHQGHQVTNMTAKVKWYSFTRFQAPRNKNGHSKTNIQVLSEVIIPCIAPGRCKPPLPKYKWGQQGVFPCITKETHHAPALQRDPGSESGAQKTMLSHLGGWFIGWWPISVFAKPPQKRTKIASKWPKEPLHFPDQPFWTTFRWSGKLIILCFVSFKEFGSPKKLVGFYFCLSWKWAASF